MNDTPDSESEQLVYEPDEEATYTLEIAARLTGVNTETILHYQEQDFIQTSTPDSESPVLGDEALRTVRQIEHLRQTCEVNEAGLRLILKLMDELELLRNHLRTRH